MLLLLLQAEGTQLAMQPWELGRHVTTNKHRGWKGQMELLPVQKQNKAKELSCWGGGGHTHTHSLTHSLGQKWPLTASSL